MWKDKLDAKQTEETSRRLSHSDVVGNSSLLPNTTPTHALRVTYLDTSCSEAVITSPASPDTPLYNISYRLRNPNLRITRPGDTNYFGSATTHIFSSKIEIDLPLRGTGLRLKPSKDLNAHMTYSSPALSQQTLTWQSHHHYGYFDLVCVDATGTAIASISTKGWKTDKFGKIELGDAVWRDEAVREEILVSGLTLCWQGSMAKTPSYAPGAPEGNPEEFEPKAMGTGSSLIKPTISPWG